MWASIWRHFPLNWKHLLTFLLEQACWQHIPRLSFIEKVSVSLTPVKSPLQLRARIFPFLLQQFRKTAVVFPFPIVGRPRIVGGVALFSGLFYFAVHAVFWLLWAHWHLSLYLSSLMLPELHKSIDWWFKKSNKNWEILHHVSSNACLIPISSFSLVPVTQN